MPWNWLLQDNDEGNHFRGYHSDWGTANSLHVSSAGLNSPVWLGYPIVTHTHLGAPGNIYLQDFKDWWFCEGAHVGIQHFQPHGASITIKMAVFFAKNRFMQWDVFMGDYPNVNGMLMGSWWGFELISYLLRGEILSMLALRLTFPCWNLHCPLSLEIGLKMTPTACCNLYLPRTPIPTKNT